MYKINDTVNKFLLAEDKFMPEMQLKQPASLDKSGFTYSASEAFTKNKERIQKFEEKKDTKLFYKNELVKACFQHDMAYGNFKDLARRTTSETVLREKTFSISKTPRYDEYQRGLASMLYNFFDKKTTGSGVKAMSNEKLAEELHKAII